MLAWIFPNPSLRSALIYLRSLDLEFSNQVSWRTLRVRVRRHLIRNAKEVENRVVVHGDAPSSVTLNVIVGLARRDLTSGHQHTLRGILNHEGASTYAIMRKALDFSVTRGMTLDHARQELETIERGIAFIG